MLGQGHNPNYPTGAKGQAVHPHLLEGGRLHGTLRPQDREAKARQGAHALCRTLALEGDRLPGMLPLGHHNRGKLQLQINRNPHGMLGLGLVKVRLHRRQAHVDRLDWLQRQSPSRQPSRHPAKRSRFLVIIIRVSPVVIESRKNVVE